MEALHVILLSGTVGVGKTTVLLELGDVLEAGEDPYALLDLDWLSWVRPSGDVDVSVQQILVDNLAHVCRTFRQAGVRRLVTARAVETLHDVDLIRAALGTPVVLTVVCLTARPGVVAERLRGRDTGDRLAEHLSQAGHFASAPGSLGIEEITVATDQIDAASVAQQVLVRVGWAA